MTTRIDASLNRSFVLANEEIFVEYHRERADIERRYMLPSGDPDESDVLIRCRAVAMRELREKVCEAVRLGCGGRCLIPV